MNCLRDLRDWITFKLNRLSDEKKKRKTNKTDKQKDTNYEIMHRRFKGSDDVNRCVCLCVCVCVCGRRDFQYVCLYQICLYLKENISKFSLSLSFSLNSQARMCVCVCDWCVCVCVSVSIAEENTYQK